MAVLMRLVRPVESELDSGALFEMTFSGIRLRPPSASLLEMSERFL